MTKRIATVEITGPLKSGKSRARTSFLDACKSGKYRGEFFGFETPELLWKRLTPKRWELLRAMQGAGEMSLREAARRVDRDVKAVHRDAHALLVIGLLEKTSTGKLVCPYSEIKVDFALRPVTSSRAA
jgi:predicted transcriptional regulator